MVYQRNLYKPTLRTASLLVILAVVPGCSDKASSGQHSSLPAAAKPKDPVSPAGDVSSSPTPAVAAASSSASGPAALASASPVGSAVATVSDPPGGTGRRSSKIAGPRGEPWYPLPEGKDVLEPGYYPGEITAPADAPRVYAKTRHVWVNYEPSFDSGWVGFLWFGGSAAVRDPNPIKGNDNCPAWYAMAPYGYVCVDGESATLDPNDPVYKGIKPYAPRLDSPWPHRYGESRDYQRYKTVPSKEEQLRREWDYKEHVERLEEAARGAKKIHEKAQGVDQTPSTNEPVLLPPLHATLTEPRKRIVIGSTSTWSTDFLQNDRTWYLGADLAFFPKDRVAPYPVSYFHGVELDDKIKPPMAFFRKRERPKYKLSDGHLTETQENWPRHGWVLLTGKSMTHEGKTFWETNEPGIYTAESDATIIRASEKTPWGATVGEKDATGKTPKGRATWMEASILGGWLLAYEGTKPVFATLIAPGRGGPPARGIDPLKTASTPTGAWPITGKFATAMMVAAEDLIHSDVPWAMNFHGPHALHGAYWHGDWGEKKSAGCINVSPIDGRYLFHWVEPPIPEGWHGVRWDQRYGPATWFIVRDI